MCPYVFACDVTACLRVCPVVSASDEECPGGYACVRMCPRVFVYVTAFVRLYPHLSSCVQCVRVFSNVFACVPYYLVCPHVSACVHVFSGVSACVRV